LDTSNLLVPEPYRKNKDFVSQRYRLFGVVLHSGSLFGGHYTAYVRPFKERPNEWVYCSDSHTRLVTWEEVKRCQAYVLFYERIQDDVAGTED
jgi:ubiquitin carboxyl-terminal hydrolase 16/45